MKIRMKVGRPQPRRVNQEEPEVEIVIAEFVAVALTGFHQRIAEIITLPSLVVVPGEEDHPLTDENKVIVLPDAGENREGLVAAFDLLALGIPVQLDIPGRAEPVMIARGDPHGKLYRLLANHPEVAVSAQIADRPEAAVANGDVRPPDFATRQRKVGSDGQIVEGTETSPMRDVIAALHRIDYRVTRKGDGWRSKCPRHGGKTWTSLGITETPEGKVLLHCFGGCRTEEIVTELGLTMGDLFPAATPNATTSNPAPPPTLPEEFWRARTVLAEIRRAAHAQTQSADAVLGATLARLSAGMPYELKLPGIVGRPVPLCLFSVLIGSPGTGKSSSYGIASQLLKFDPTRVAENLPIGSGEGLIEALFDLREEEEPTTHKVRKVKKQVFWNAAVYADEGAVLSALSQRTGSTLLPILRTIFTGGLLGQANASIERKRIVAAGDYTFGVVISLQEELAGELLQDEAAGTPQRLLWFSAIDPSIPDEETEPPGLELSGVYNFLDLHRHPGHDYYFDVASPIKEEIRAATLARSRGQVTAKPMQAHANLLRLKVAGLLAILDRRMRISEEDWRLATMIKTTSDGVLAAVQATCAAAAARKEHETSGRLAGRHVEATAQELAWRTIECAKRIRDKVRARPGVTARELQQNLRRWREDFNDGLEYALAEGWIVEKVEPGQGTEKRALYPQERTR